jgi:hypothetical protein
MSVPEHLTINTDGLPFDSLLSDWRWLVSPDFKPILMTAFGDLFLCDQSGRIHFLDLMSGGFKQVAESQEEFDRLCEDRERRRSWFIGFLLTEVRKVRGDLAAGECYSCKKPLSLGGQLETDNFERTDLEVHYSILGQIHQQTTRLPPGTKIHTIKIESPPEDTKPRRWWQTFVGQ